MKLPYNWKKHLILALDKLRIGRKKSALLFRFIQDDIYEIDKVAHSWLRRFMIVLTLLVIASILLPIGFELTPELARLNIRIEKGLLIGFVANVILRFVLTNDRILYLKKRWFEILLTIFAVYLITGFNISLLDDVDLTVIGIETPENFILNIIKGYLLLFVSLKVVYNLPELLDKQRNIARLLVYSFVVVILVGCALLMLPGSTIDGEGLAFIDALFTSTSAVCVTGLIVVDTAIHFTLFDQIVILVLIQLGGIGIVTFATFLFIYISGGLGLAQMNAIKSVVAEENTNLLSSTLKKVIGFIFVIEGLATVVYYFSWDYEFVSTGQRFFFSVFHSVSAFCNAGFSLFTNSLADAHNVTNIPVNITTMILIILGGLGFSSIWEIIQRENPNAKWRRKLSIHTRIVLSVTGILIFGGAILILALEWNSTLADYSFGNKVLISFFQSVTTRTAGFNSVNIGEIGVSATLVMLVLMIIGGSPASTAGGIKTTTIAIVLRSIAMTVTGENRMEIFNRTIPNSIIFQAMSVFFLAFICIVISTILLSITEEFPFLDLLFEEVSAFATVGLSRGITSELSTWGKAILTVSMFWGRVGILTFMVAFAKRQENLNYQYPEETLMVS